MTAYSTLISRKTVRTIHRLLCVLCRSISRTAAQQFRRVLLMSILAVTTLNHSLAYSQSNPKITLAPIVMLLLLEEEEEQCPLVSDETTRENNFVISSQGNLDDLAGVTRIEGDLNFFNAPADLDLSPLDSLIQISGNLNFQENMLTDISGFNCLSNVGNSLRVRDNILLNSFSGFERLSNIGVEFRIQTNSITTLSEFPALISIGGDFTINNNDRLATVSGFPVLTTIAGFLQIINSALINEVTGFPALLDTDNVIIGSNSALSDISGFSALRNIRDRLVISNNDNLTSLSGFTSLTDVGTESTELFRGIIINNNERYDCQSSPPAFRFANQSSDNLVDCPILQ